MDWVTFRVVDVLALLSGSEMSAYRDAAQSSVVVQGNSTLGSAVLSKLDSVEHIMVGMSAAGSTLPDGLTVVSIDSSEDVTLSSGTGVTAGDHINFTFTEPDKLAAIVRDLIAELRARVEHVLGTDTATDTVPAAMKYWAAVLARHRLLTTLPIEISKDRVAAAEQAEKFIEQIVVGKSGMAGTSGGAACGYEDRLT